MKQLDASFQYVNRFILSISLIISCCAVSLGRAPDVRFTSGYSTFNIPLRIFNNHVYLLVSLNNAKSLWFLLDTRSGNIVNTSYATTLCLRLNSAGQTSDVAG